MRRRGFTLVELLVVLAVIAVLGALLFPALRGVWRQATVLVTPIVYLGDDTRLHLTDRTGQWNTPLMAQNEYRCPVCHTPPAWSPSGEAILFRSNFGGDTAVLDPLGKHPRAVRGMGKLLGWLDGQRFVEGAQGGELFVRQVTSGALEWTGRPAYPVYFLAPAPPNAPGPLIASVRMGGFKAPEAICFLRKDFNLAKPVYITVGRGEWGYAGDFTVSMQCPRVDPTGEWVGWTDVTRHGAEAAFKHVRDPALAPPTVFGNGHLGYMRIYFCDWTDRGELLCNVSRNNKDFQLVIFDRDGRLVAEVDAESPPTRGIVASWRHYGHQ